MVDPAMAGTQPDLEREHGLPLECLRTFWVMVGSTNVPITCALYRTPVGLEVRAGHGERDALLRHHVFTMVGAEAYAAIWKIAAEARGFRLTA